MIVERSRQPNPKSTQNRPRRRAISKNILAVVDSLPDHIAMLDASGTILAVNAAWHQFAEANGYVGTGHGVGANYLEICQQVSGTDAHAAEQAIRLVMAREQAEYSYEYAFHGPNQQRWFLFRAARFAGAGPICVIVSHADITHYKEIEDRSRLLETAHRLARRQAEQALGETRSRLQALLDHAQDAFLLADDEGHYIDANSAACVLTGYSYAELLRLSVYDLTPPADRPKLPNAWQLFIQAGTWRSEFTILRKDGGTVPVELNAVARIEPGVHLSALRDISLRRQVEDALRNHVERLSILHEIDQAILSAGSLEDIAQAVLGSIYRLIPYWRASVIVFDFDLGEFQLVAVCQNGVPQDRPVQRFLIAEMAEAEAMILALRRGEQHVYDLGNIVSYWPEAKVLLAGGMRYQICIPLIAQGELFGSVQLVTPTQELFDSVYMPLMREMLASLAIGVQQARLFEQVRVGRARQHELSRQLVVAQELERRQLARELHDQIGQNLAVLNMNLSSARHQLSHESAQRLDARLAKAIQIVDQMVEQIRNVMAELRPAILDDFGLVAALRWYTRHFARHTDLAVLLDVEEPPSAPRLPSDIETALFRLAQEALTNVLKHAHARLATCKLTIIDQTIRLMISDDGVGFNPSASRRPHQRWSLGLMTMQERVEAVGGRLVIDSTPGQGTRIIAEVVK